MKWKCKKKKNIMNLVLQFQSLTILYLVLDHSASSMMSESASVIDSSSVASACKEEQNEKKVLIERRAKAVTSKENSE